MLLAHLLGHLVEKNLQPYQIFPQVVTGDVDASPPPVKEFKAIILVIPDWVGGIAYLRRVVGDLTGRGAVAKIQAVFLLIARTV